MNELFQQNGAVFSDCRKYRYCLWRIWDESKPMVMFIGLNPSTANESANDPTIRRVISFAKSWGFGGVYMMNLFAYVTPYPKDLYTGDPVGDNNKWLREVSEKCEKVVFAWGKFYFLDREAEVQEMFPNSYALMLNKDGSPRHPLYVPGSVNPVLFN